MKQLGSIGGFLALTGLGSIVLYFLGYNLKILMWIDGWGSAVGWAIRVGLVVLGGALVLLGIRGSSTPEPTKQE